MDNYYVFPKVEVVDGEPCILWETPMGRSTVPAQLASLREIHSFLDHFFTHQFRYGGDRLLDNSGMWQIPLPLSIFCRTVDLC